MAYPFKIIEKKWQCYWEENASFQTRDADSDSESDSRPKYYVLDMFPYPSGAGLHVGHPEGYTATDIIARYKRMCGYNVLHPMGWDAFGLPAERYAIEKNIHPRITTKQNIDNFRRQLKSLGFSYDWDRELNTTEPDYYRWTQWIFLAFFNSYYDEKKKKACPIVDLELPSELEENSKEARDYINSKRLAYLSNAAVNWCPELGAVLANEELEEWTNKGYTVQRRPMRQWMLRITAYADRLLDDLKYLDWPKGTLELQKNWIGRSEGALICFPLKASLEVNMKTHAKSSHAKSNIEESEEEPHFIEVFTTRADTIYGVSYLVLAPEHPLAEKLSLAENKKEVLEYIEATAKRSELERKINKNDAEDNQKSGVFIGAYAYHPLTKEKIPIWIADYVLMGYGTGAVMAVPAHDERDYDFAKKFNLPIKQVVAPSASTPSTNLKKAYIKKGVNINSGILDGMTSEKAIPKIIAELEKQGLAEAKINYGLRDWLFSRQRYWGEPIPISYDKDANYYTVNDQELPLELPEVTSFKPDPSGESALCNAKDWLSYQAEDGENKQELRRETNTMPQWAGSCWYYLRFIDPQNKSCFVDPKKEAYWMGSKGVDLYIGGAEHAVLHLLYARFWHKFLYDLGYVSSVEPFHKLVHQGLILGADGQKMSKSLGNVVNPDDVVEKYGADSFRLFEMFLGPLEKSKPWSQNGIEGIYRFLSRVWRLFILDEGDAKFSEDFTQDSRRYKIDPKLLEASPKKTVELLHRTIKKVTEDIESLSFNTAISTLMSFVNEVYHSKQISKQGAESFVKLLAPFAPHLAEELWQLLECSETISSADWPNYDLKKTKFDEIEFVIQVNGKIKSKLKLKAGLAKEELEKIALADENVQAAIEKAGGEIIKTIVVPNKLVNFFCKT